MKNRSKDLFKTCAIAVTLLMAILPIMQPLVAFAQAFTSISMYQDFTSISIGTTSQFSAEALDENSVPLPIQPVFTWTSSDPSIASIDANGLATGIAVGDVVITATGTDTLGNTISAAVALNVAVPVLASVAMTPTDFSIANGNTVQLTAVGFDQNGIALATQPTFTFTSGDTTVATIDANGLATGVSVGGPIVITATTGIFSTTSNLTITAPLPVLTSLTVSPATATIHNLDTLQLSATPLDQTGAPFIGATVTWSSSNSATATVDTNGLVSGLSTLGLATITATATDGINTVTATSVITVADPAYTAAQVAVHNVRTDCWMIISNNVYNLTNFISSHPGGANAIVSRCGIDGTVAFNNIGHSPAADALLATYLIGTLTTSPVLTSITVTPATASIDSGATQQLTASPLDGTGATFVGATVTWSSSDSTIAAVDANGLVTGQPTIGTVTITATATSGAVSVTGTSSITVNTPAPVLTSISITPDTVTIDAGTTQQFTAVGVDQFGSPFTTPITFTWNSSNQAIATVDQTGLATGVAAGGPVTITATSGTISGTANLAVAAAGSISISAIPDPSTSLTAISGTSSGIDLANPASTVMISLLDTTSGLFWDGTVWSSSGIFFTPPTTINSPLAGDWSFDVAFGLGAVTFTNGDIYQVDAQAANSLGNTVIAPAATFTFATPALTSIAVTPATASIVAGTTQQFVAQALDQAGAPLAIQPTFAWTSNDTATASINGSTGLATGVAAGGPVTITATSGTISGTASLTVTAAPLVLTSITVSPTTSSIAVGHTQQFTAVGLDQNGITLATQPTFSWTSNNAAVTSVNGSTGLATGVAAGGPATITATSGTISGTASLTVTANSQPTVTAIPAQTVQVGSTLTFTVSATDPDNDPLVYGLDSAAPAGATIGSLNGAFSWTPTATGTFTFNISVFDGFHASAVMAPVTITVTASTSAPVLTAISITPSNASIDINATQQFSAIGLDQNNATLAVQPTFSWSDSNTSIATISATGLATAVKAGGPITITATSGSISKTASLTVLAVKASPAQGNYTDVVNVTLTAIGADKIMYTTDGTTPTCTVGTTYNTPFKLIKTTAVKAVACTASVASPVQTFNYNIALDVNPDQNHMKEFMDDKILETEGTDSHNTANITSHEDIKFTMHDTNGDSTVDMPSGTVISRIDGSRFDATLLDSHIVGAGTMSGFSDSHTTVAGALHWGIANVGLQFSQPVRLSIFVGNSFNGQTLNIMRSIDGQSNWTNDGLSASTCVVANGLCSFTATKASYYTADYTASSGSTGIIYGGGGGGGYSGNASNSAVNSSLTIDKTQYGSISQSFADNSKLSTSIPTGAVQNKMTFTISQGTLNSATMPKASAHATLVGNKTFIVTAKNDDSSTLGSLTMDAVFNLSLPSMPADMTNTGLYYWSDSQNMWALLTSVVANSNDYHQLTFNTNLLTTFAVFNIAGRPTGINVANGSEAVAPTTTTPSQQVLGVKVYANGTLLRDKETGRIYVVTNGMKHHILNMAELRKYAGYKIINVDMETLNQYSDTDNGTVATTTTLPNGSLLRDITTYKIYLLTNGQIQYVSNLAALKKLSGHKTYKVSSDTIAQYSETENSL